jgi:opacity protein-like surface antigen
MTLSLKIPLAALSLFMGMTAVRAEDGAFVPPTGLYLAAGAGADWIGDSKLTIFDTRVDTHWAAGWGGYVALGYRFPIGLRVELEGSGRDALNHSFNKGDPWYGTQWDTSAMANILYDIDTATRFTPFVGGGVGLSHLSWGNNFRANLNELPYIYDDSGSAFGWQIIAGLAYNVTPRLALTTDFRYKGSDGYSFRSSGPSYTNITNFDYRTSDLFFGLRYSFD